MAANPTQPNQPPPSEISPNRHGQEAWLGSSIAALWLKVNQEDHPPASIPSTLILLHQCPQCNLQLDAEPRIAGQQSCKQCGWSSQPANAKWQAAVTNNQADQELLQLLEQAALDSKENMKPRRNRG